MDAVINRRSTRIAFVVLMLVVMPVIVAIAFGASPGDVRGDDRPTVDAGSSVISPDPSGLGNYYSDEYDSGGITGVDAGGAVLLAVGLVGVGFGLARVSYGNVSGYAMATVGAALGLIGAVMIGDDQERGLIVGVYFAGIAVNAVGVLLVHGIAKALGEQTVAWRSSLVGAVWGGTLIFQVLWAIYIYRAIWPSWYY